MGSLFFVLSLIFGCKEPLQKPIRVESMALDTVCQFTFYRTSDSQHASGGEDVLAHIDSLFNRHSQDSELYRVNREASSRVSPDFQFLVERSLDFARLTGGAFNPALGALVDLWGIGSEAPRIPDPGEIEKTLDNCRWEGIIIDEGSVVKPLETRLDLGGIAKGFAADQIREHFKHNSVESAIINLGGNVLVMGEKPDGSAWKIGVQNPHSNRGDYVGILHLRDTSMVTSGNYERYFEERGIRYHHLFDGRTGYPANNGLSSVTVITRSSLEADALSTSLFVMGLDKGFALASHLDGTEALFITEDGNIYLTSGLEEIFYLSNDSFTLSSL